MEDSFLTTVKCIGDRKEFKMGDEFDHSPLSACCFLFPSVQEGFPSGARASPPQPTVVSARGPPRWLLLTDLYSAASPAAF